MRAEVTLPLDPAGLVGAFAASFNHGLSNGSTFYSVHQNSNVHCTKAFLH